MKNICILCVSCMHGYAMELFLGDIALRRTWLVYLKKSLLIIVNIRQQESCWPYFIKENILTLLLLYIMEVALFVHKQPAYFAFIKNPATASIIWSSLHPNSVTIHCLGAGRIRFILIYNKIRVLIKNENDINKFKNKLKQYLIKKLYYARNEFITEKQRYYSHHFNLF